MNPATRFLSKLLLPAFVCAGAAGAQCARQPMQVALGFGIDTSTTRGWGDFAWREPVTEIVRNWCSYLLAAGESVSGRQVAAQFWSAAERRQWPDYDLPRASASLIGSATVLDVRPARPGSTTEFVVKTLFARADSRAGTASPSIRPFALISVIAVREAGRWVFANMLPRLTGVWKRERVGAITYVLEPGYSFRRARAQAAVRFADSLARAFAVAPLSPVTYYLTSTPDAMNHIIGLEWTFTYGGRGGGYARYRNHQIFSGDPQVGEDYRHELAHFVLAPLSPASGSHPFVSEGVATWLGGTLGMTPKETLSSFAEFLRMNPTITLDSAMMSADRDEGFRPAGAVLSAMVYARGGASAIREFLSTKQTDSLPRVVERLLGAPWSEVCRAWRTAASAPGNRSAR